MKEASELKLQPYWWEAAPPSVVEPIGIPAKVDTTIIGAGYTGLSAGLTLARAGCSVVVIDAGAPGGGASSRNAGMINSRVKISFSKLARVTGLDRAIAIYREASAAFEWFMGFVETEKIDCKLAVTGQFLGACTQRDYGAAGRELDLMRRHLGTRGEIVPRAEQRRAVGTDAYFGGLLLPSFGGLHPGLYCAGLIECAEKVGVVVAGNTRALSVDRDRGGFSVVTDRGRISASHVIVATNGYTDGVVPWLRRRIIPIPSQMIATAELDPVVIDRLIPHGRMVTATCKLTHYYRPSPDSRRLLFGGRAGALLSDPRAGGASLHRDLIRLFPDLAGTPITHFWSGFTGWTFDTLPHIGSKDEIRYAVGYCGTGVAMATYLGRKLALRILGSAEGRTAFDEGIFPTRPFYNGHPWFLPAVLAYYGLRDQLGV